MWCVVRFVRLLLQISLVHFTENCRFSETTIERRKKAPEYGVPFHIHPFRQLAAILLYEIRPFSFASQPFDCFAFVVLCRNRSVFRRDDKMLFCICYTVKIRFRLQYNTVVIYCQ